MEENELGAPPVEPSKYLYFTVHICFESTTISPGRWTTKFETRRELITHIEDHLKKIPENATIVKIDMPNIVYRVEKSDIEYEKEFKKYEVQKRLYYETLDKIKKIRGRI